MSILGIQHAHFTHPHQIVGPSVALLVALQVYFGQANHIRCELFKKRTWFRFVHMDLGKMVIYGGMVNAVLGFWLCKRVVVMAVTEGAGAVVVCIMEFVAVAAHIRRKREVERGERANGWSSNHPKLKDGMTWGREVRAEYGMNYVPLDKQDLRASQRYKGYRPA